MKRDGLGKETPAIVVVAGPTASGKSGLALALAREFDGAVINADAIQVYRELAILTARPTAADMAAAPHRLYGVLPAAERGTTARWRALAVEAIDTALGEGRLPVVVGGTGLYLKALMDGLSLAPSVGPEWRDRARARRDEIGAAAFHAELAARDPAGAARLAPGDTTRVIRAWEVVHATGRPLAAFHVAPGAPPAYRFTTIVLSPERGTLYAACEARCTRMLEEGALDEVRALLALGLDPMLPAMKAVGVREIAALLTGETSRDEALSAFQQATRNYAKRQSTWFRRQISTDFPLSEQYSESLDKEIFAFIRKSVDLNGRRQ